VPIASYRVQLNKGFDFQDLKHILPYLNELGVSHVYASPISQAKKGSTHGYDVVNHNKISEELGGEQAFRTLIGEMKALGLSWLQDIVPNHASYSLENLAVKDLWEKGCWSRYSSYYDVDWSHPHQKLSGKILLPVLKQPYLKCLREGQISLVYNNGFNIKYDNIELPINEEMQRELSGSGCLEEVLVKINHDSQRLNRLLSRQYYILSYWKTALKHINYRRFFDIIDLIGLKIERMETFEYTHRLILELVKEGCFSGIRIDHIDGLYQPDEYLNKLRQELPEAYLIVEKILTNTEQIPKIWPVQGSTGYDFLNYTNKLFIQKRNESIVDAFYKKFTGNMHPFSDLLYDAKRHVAETYFRGDIENLAYLFKCTLQAIGYSEQFDYAKLSIAIEGLFACFPVYRSYIGNLQNTKEPSQAAINYAIKKNPTLNRELSAITYLFEHSQTQVEALHALMRMQQFSGSIMAKGFEDTALYRYVRLISLNDVGSNPSQFGISVEQFHKFNLPRQQYWPLTLNTLSTHDTKRGEDIRARLNVLSEVPSEFQANVGEWGKNNCFKKLQIDGLLAPDPNEEYYIYQTFLGAYPSTTEEVEEFRERIKLHITKALREAKIHSNWLSPNLSYETAVISFALNLLEDNKFMDSFLPFQRKISLFGLFNTLSQTLLKITCPGIPDFYQGSELFDLSMVDPDNRRPVDFQKRKKLLAEIKDVNPIRATELLSAYIDAKAKLYVIHKALMLRRTFRQLFEEGKYVPLAVEGEYEEHILAFAREKGKKYVVTIVPRLLASLLHSINNESGTDLDDKILGLFDESAEVWAGTYVTLPGDTPKKWVDVFTNKTIISSSGRLFVRDVLGNFPVALLVGDNIV
jgi:(1->4)-alpha-D-glucan 1-alpha-D-glucosylmutase